MNILTKKDIIEPVFNAFTKYLQNKKLVHTSTVKSRKEIDRILKGFSLNDFKYLLTNSTVKLDTQFEIYLVYGKYTIYLNCVENILKIYKEQ